MEVLKEKEQLPRRSRLKDAENYILGLSILLAAGVLIPLLVLALYSFPATDDFAYLPETYQAIRSGAGVWQVLQTAFATAERYYYTWQGRYFDDLVSAFGFGIAIPKFYFLGAHVTILVFASGAVVLVKRVCHTVFGLTEKKRAWSIAFVITAFLLMFVPYGVEAFYWYVGATGYTMTYGLLLWLCGVLVKLEEKSTWKKSAATGASYAGSALLVICLGGTNYSTALLTGELLFLYMAWQAWRFWQVCRQNRLPGDGHAWERKEKRRRLLFAVLLFALFAVCFACNALSPGNEARMNNVESFGVWGSIRESFRGLLYLAGEWFHVPVVILLVMVGLLFGTAKKRNIAGAEEKSAGAEKKGTGTERKSGAVVKLLFVTFVSFGLLASILTPPYFAGATWGPGRLINTLYYSYLLFLTGVLCGVSRLVQQSLGKQSFGKRSKASQETAKAAEEAGDTGKKARRTAAVFLICLLVFAGYTKYAGLLSNNASGAALLVARGDAAAYLQENKERWALYEDVNQTNLRVKAFENTPYLLYHDDIQADVTDWRNYTVSAFFGKESVGIEVD